MFAALLNLKLNPTCRVQLHVLLRIRDHILHPRKTNGKFLLHRGLERYYYLFIVFICDLFDDNVSKSD